MTCIVPKDKTVAEVLPNKPQSEIAKLSLEEMWELGKRHLMEQKKVSRNENDSECMYRGCEGLMCAAGPFISHEVYSKHMESSRVYKLHVLEKAGEYLGNGPLMFNNEQIKLLSKLQSIHDGSYPSEWQARLSEAEESGIVPN